MQRFTHLFIEMDRTKRTTEKVAAMERYFRQAPARDAAWALHFLSGRRLKRLLPGAGKMLRGLVAEHACLPPWIIGESHEAVGDLAETLAMLFPDSAAAPAPMPLHQVIESRMLPLRGMDESRQREIILQCWREMDFSQRLVFNKLITGEFRVGAAQTLIIRSLAAAADVPAAVMAHRFTGKWEPTEPGFLRLLSPGQGAGEPGQPYPFFLGYPLEIPLQELGDEPDWQAEWKYDGIRAQAIHRGDPGAVVLWSRGDELITPAFPEIASAAAGLPPNTVLDGEILAWENDRPLPFGMLQRRLNRKQVEPTLWIDVPVAFLAFDLLERGGADLRETPLRDRRRHLESIIAGLPGDAPIRAAPLVAFDSWARLSAQRAGARERAVEGLMLKRLDGAYGVGRRRGDWWKWKIDPHTIDAVLIYAQSGSGRRSGLFTDYTFGVWEGGQLVPVAKAYSGLTDDELRQVDRFIRANTIDRHGPVRVVRPELVFELAFQGVQESGRHKAGLALRFPRMSRWRQDKPASEADTLETLRAVFNSSRLPS